jgi:DNA-binding response OmpR family regulator
VIAVISSNHRERLAFSTLCDSYQWPAIDFDSTRTAIRQFNRFLPKIIILRHRLADGYSDDVMVKIRQMPGGAEAKIVILVDASLSSSAEARQLKLGADCVLRDPIRVEILVAYIEKFLAERNRRQPETQPAENAVISIAGARLSPADRRLQRGSAVRRLSPKEVELLESLFHARGAVVRYEILYSDVIGRRFGGDTSNMRVLLGKLRASFRTVGVNLSRWIEVIPKTGYRLLPPPRSVNDAPSPKARGSGKKRKTG